MRRGWMDGTSWDYVSRCGTGRFTECGQNDRPESGGRRNQARSVVREIARIHDRRTAVTRVPAEFNTDSEVRAKAAVGLGHIGRGAAAAEEALTLQLKEEEPEPRLRAAESLVKVAADSTLANPISKAAAESKSSETRDRWWKTRAQRLLKEINNAKAGHGDNE